MTGSSATARPFYSLLKRWWLLVIGTLLTLAVLVVGAFYVGQTLEEGELLEVTGRTQTSFAVYYVENTLFPENPVPARFHFIRQLTDYIELSSGFNATFTESMNVTYSYTARTRFVVNYTGSGNPMIFEEVIILSEYEGHAFTSSLFFLPHMEDSPGGVYRIDLEVFEIKFDEFVEYTLMLQGVDTEEEGIHVVRAFAATLEVDFTYNIRVPHHGLNETVTNSFSFAIGASVFSLAPTGPAGFTASVLVEPEQMVLSLPAIMFFVVLFVLGGLGIYFGYQNLDYDENEAKRKANDILKKYSTEIVVSKAALDISGLKLVMLEDFEDILKLAINLSKHVNCFKDYSKAEFVTVVDEYAYCHRIDFGVRTDTIFDLDDDDDDDFE